MFEMSTDDTSNLTIIYLTLNKHPETWKMFHKANLLKAAGDYPIITVSPEDVGVGKWVEDKGPYSHENMYRQIVYVSKFITTPYIAVAEDDTLYPAEHFNEFRPKERTVSYNTHRWSLYTWTDMYNIKDRISNCTLIADRKYYIEAWEERFKKFPDGLPPHRVSEIGRANQERWMGIVPRVTQQWKSSEPVIQLNHPNGTDSVGMKKRMGRFRAYDIPYWGRADTIKGYYEYDL